MTKKKKLLFIYLNSSPFVQGDLEILQNLYKVTPYHFNSRRLFLIFSLIQQFFYLLFYGWHYHKTYIWFGDYHSFLPILFSKIYKKKSFLVVGGYDVCRIKKINYGSFMNPIRGYMTRFSMNHCTLNLCVSHYIKRKVSVIAPKSAATILYNGVTYPSSNETNLSKENIVLTVGNIHSPQKIKIKGIDLFIRLAWKNRGML